MNRAGDVRRKGSTMKDRSSRRPIPVVEERAFGNSGWLKPPTREKGEKMQTKTAAMEPEVRVATGLVYSAVVLSLVAALIHLWVTPEHFEEWWGYGTFMLVSFVAQAIYAAALLVRPRWPLLLLAGASGNLAIIGMWVVSRTVGLPVGPGAGEVEGIGALDLISTASEVGLVVVLLGLLSLR